MSDESYKLIEEVNGSLTVVMGTETRPPSPEPPSSPCPGQHLITPMGEKEGWQGREGKVAIVRAVHNCTPLNAAVIMNDQERVRQILASVQSSDGMDKCDCSGSPPVCEAAYHNRLSIMKLLLESPYINVNAVNHLGLTPLCIAAGNTLDNPKMVELLIERDADVNARARDGRSPLHIAAEGGHYRIVRRLLSSKHIQDAVLFDYFTDGDIYCPPPSILAAANEHDITVNQLLSHKPHPLNITRDVKLCLWARKSLITAVTGGRTFVDDDAIAALSLGPVPVSDHGLVPVPAYGNLREMATVDEVQQYSALPATDGICMRVFQSLIIIERNVGLSNKLVSTCMTMAINVFKRCGKYELIVPLLLRIFEGISLMERLILNRGFSMMPSHLHVTLSFFLVVQFWKCIRELTEAQYSIDFQPFVVSLANDLDVILSLKDKQPCQQMDHWGEAFQTDFTHLLALLACALLTNKKSHSLHNDNKLHEIGQDLIMKYEQYAANNFTSLIHLSLRKAGGITEILKCSGLGGKRAMVAYTMLVEALLHWGCSRYLNTPFKQYFCEGELPLHMAVRLAEMDPCYIQIVDMLMCHGAHYDGVASSGLIPSRIATRDHLKACFDLSPLPLACLTARVIITQESTYQESPYIPPRLKQFIAFHDPSTV